MDDLSSIYSEKKLAYYETSYRESLLAKPQDINIAVTAAHLYGLAFICEQVGTKEGDPEYTRFSCGLEEITKVYINNNNRNSPIYIQCDDTSKSVMNRKRIILPSFNNNEEIVKIISSAKAEYDKKADKQRETEHNKKVKAVEESKLAERERLKKAADAEFESMTADYKKPAPAKEIVEEKPKAAAPDFSVADMLGIDEIIAVSAPETAVEDYKVKEETKADFDEIALPVDTEELPDAEEVFKVEIPEDMMIESVTEADIEEEERKAEEAAMKKAAEIENYKGMYVPKKEAAAVPEKKEEPAAEKPAAAPEKKEEPAAEKPAPAPEKKEEPAAPAPKKEFISQEEYKSMSLEEFQTTVMKLKAMLDSGVMTAEEFADEKAKLLKCLY